jgi:DNA primase
LGGFIPDDKVAEVRIAANIVDVISQHVALKKAGKNFVGLCPFHAEKAPSFTVTEEKQIFHCFGCGQGGNVFSFLMLYHSIGFPEAVRLLAQEYGIAIAAKHMSASQKRELEEKEILFGINAEAAGFFKRNLHKAPLGKVARGYLTKRGLTAEVIDQFSLGYAPRGWDNLVKYFSSKGAPLSDVEKAGLVIPKRGGYYDRFRDRIIFPIVDIHHRVMGFGGRCLDESLPKYLNSPETPVYHKGQSLYGLPAAKEGCRQTGSVFVVEGYFDVLALRCHGINNVVATLGTALTRQHIRIIKGHAGQATLVFDSDEAGTKAAERSLPLFVEEKVDARIMSLPEGRDPDSFVFEVGGDRFRKAADEASEMMGFLIASAMSKYGLSLQGKVRIVEALKGPLRSLSDNVSRAVYIRDLSERLDIDESAILERVRTSVKKAEGSVSASLGRTQSASRLEETIIAMMLQSPDALGGFDAREIVEAMETAALRKLGRVILDKYGENQLTARADLITQTEDPQIRSLISSLVMEEGSWDRDSCSKIVSQFRTQLRKRQEKLLLRRIREAEKADDEVLLNELLAEKQKRMRERLSALQG